ncbi:hypothetical protein ACQEU5_07110 [Marinactinospora thermotolerans]|uniref:hypothetical protein n=1 Tax=Marinactinospora thermotolerans TaxID=531310 RepID=UPI003D90E0BE
MTVSRKPVAKAAPVADVRAAAEDVRIELGRVDAQSAMLLALAGAAAALVATGPLPEAAGAARVLVGTGAAALIAAVIVLLLAVRPRLKTAPFMRCAAEPEWRPETPRERMAALSAVARSKFLRVRLAVDLLVVAVVLISAGIAWEAVG